MRLDESYFSGAETEDSVSEITGTAKPLIEYRKIFILKFKKKNSRETPDIQAINARVSTMLNTLKFVRKFSSVEYSEESYDVGTEIDVFKTGVDISGETPFRILTVAGMLLNYLQWLYREIPFAFTVTGFSDEEGPEAHDSEMDLWDFIPVYGYMDKFKKEYDPKTRTNSFVFAQNNEDGTVMKRFHQFIEEYIEISGQPVETVTADISKYFMYMSPMKSIEEIIFNGYASSAKEITNPDVIDALSEILFTKKAYKNKQELLKIYDIIGSLHMPFGIAKSSSITLTIRYTFDDTIWMFCSLNAKHLTGWKYVVEKKGDTTYVTLCLPYGIIYIDDIVSYIAISMCINVEPESTEDTIKGYIKHYTGLTKENLDALGDFVIEAAGESPVNIWDKNTRLLFGRI